MKHSLVAELLNNLINASRVGKNQVTVKKSNLVCQVAGSFKTLGYVKSVSEQGDLLILNLNENQPISHLKMLSRPGLRRYSSAIKIPRTRTRLGAILLTTPKGVLTDFQARKQKVGGELICEVW